VIIGRRPEDSRAREVCRYAVQIIRIVLPVAFSLRSMADGTIMLEQSRAGIVLSFGLDHLGRNGLGWIENPLIHRRGGAAGL